jgi:hypothetical protein
MVLARMRGLDRACAAQGAVARTSRCNPLPWDKCDPRRGVRLLIRTDLMTPAQWGEAPVKLSAVFLRRNRV